MADVDAWVFIDDNPEEADSFSRALSSEDLCLTVDVMEPAQAREKILSGKVSPRGLLVDIELSDIAGETGTGLGIAQDVRAGQKAERIREFPLVRFARRNPVAQNVGGDPSSYDLFDLNIDKSEVTRCLRGVQARLLGANEIYDFLVVQDRLDSTTAISELVGLSVDALDLCFSSSLHERLAGNQSQSVHVAAGTFIRTFIEPSGLLITAELLAIRLGIDIAASQSAWDELRSEFLADFAYLGIASTHFQRWWARGLEQWWQEEVLPGNPLALLPITERYEALRDKTGRSDLRPLTMPKTSPGDKPWRLCTLHLEADGPTYIPIDPAFGVRLNPGFDLPPWVDPFYAELGEALRRKEDLRLSRTDLARLERRFRST